MGAGEEKHVAFGRLEGNTVTRAQLPIGRERVELGAGRFRIAESYFLGPVDIIKRSDEFGTGRAK